MSHESMLQPHQPYDKSDVIEGRLTNQERTMSVLLEQALRIKEEVVASLHFTQGSVQSETSSRRLLESHILTITHIVKQLSTDIQVLKSQIAQRDSVTSGTSFAMQSLDHKNLAGFGDLRGRVARCDASIAKLSGDVSDRAHEIARLQQELSEVKSGLGERLREMDTKLSQAVSRLECCWWSTPTTRETAGLTCTAKSSPGGQKLWGGKGDEGGHRQTQDVDRATAKQLSTDTQTWQ
nr:protein FAM81B [Salvelinus alpinus]